MPRNTREAIVYEGHFGQAAEKANQICKNEKGGAVLPKPKISEFFTQIGLVYIL